MKRKWTRSLALSLGLLAGTGVRAEEVAWTSPPASPIAITTPAASIGKPVVIASSSQETTGATAAIAAPVAGTVVPGSPAPVANASGSSGVSASIGRPVSAATTSADPHVQPAGFSVPDPSAALVRGQAPELISAKPMPTGNAGDSEVPFAGTTPGASVPGSATPAPTLHGWRRADDVVASSRTGSSAPIMPATSPMGVPGPVGHSGPAPLFTGLPDPCAPNCGPDCGAGKCGPGVCCGGTCGGACCDGCGGCCPNNRWYVSGEYLLWWLKGDRTPPLVTAGNPNVDGMIAGLLGQPTTRVLYGGRDLGTDGQSGGRLCAGWWFGDCHLWAIELGGFVVGNNNRFNRFSTGDPALVRPFIGAVTGAPGGEQVAIPTFPGIGGLAGDVDVRRKSSFWGGDINLRRNILCGPNGFVDMFFGYRMLSLRESLSITESLVAVADRGPTMAGTTFMVFDRFATNNVFYGGQVGVNGEWRWGSWSLGGKFGVALGNTHQSVDIGGVTATTPPAGGPTVGAGGLLALPSNIGHYSRNQLSVVPELGLTLGYQFTPCLRGFIGYNFLYWNNVVRPGEQIDPRVNPTFLPGGAQTGPRLPAFTFNGSDFWAQGLTVGLEMRF